MNIFTCKIYYNYAYWSEEMYDRIHYSDFLFDVNLLININLVDQNKALRNMRSIYNYNIHNNFTGIINLSCFEP